MEPAIKKSCLIKHYGTGQWILQKKKSFYLTELNGINHWIPRKKSSCPNQQIGINHLILQKNKTGRAIWYKSLNTLQKQQRTEWLNSLNSAQKQKREECYVIES